MNSEHRNTEITQAEYDRQKAWTERFAQEQRAALSTEAQPEVTGAVYQVMGVENGWQTIGKEAYESLRDNTVFETRVLYPPSAIQAAVREKLEAALNACLVEAHGNGSEQWRFGASKCADRIRALMEPKS